ncbi:MAG: hypothetical protein P4L43_14560 [Syntrophobacteraceae bacterium]|nr:hypothetical protein [Syntrophobacteraceae bacterium]
MDRTLTLAVPAAILGYLLLSPQAAMAIQSHGGPEGLYVHQMAHILFLFSMGALIYWLRDSGLIKAPGWRYVQYGAFCLILWNIDAVLGHYLDGHGSSFVLADEGSWSARVHFGSGSGKLVALYYFTKFDHLFCVPGIIFLYMGLRRLLKQV